MEVDQEKMKCGRGEGREAVLEPALGDLHL